VRQSNTLRAAWASLASGLALACKAPASDASGGFRPPSTLAASDAAPARPLRSTPPVPAIASAALAASAARAPEDGPREGEMSGHLWLECHDGFAPRSTPRIDVQRLGLACGPSTGLTPFAHLNGSVDESGAPVVLSWQSLAGDCFRLFAVASSPVDDLEVEIASEARELVSLSNQNRRWLVVAEDRPFCVQQPGKIEARFSTHSGRGDLAAAVWRGAGMWPRPGSWRGGNPP
jgi:hypothetical protein